LEYLSLVDAFSFPFMQRALTTMAILAVASGIVGFFISIRDLEFVTDGLIHAVFPGLVIGFAISGTAGILPGAFLAALLAALILTVITRTKAVSQDAAVAVVLTSAFSLGIVIVSRQQNYVSQLEELLFGRLLTVTSDQLIQISIVAVISIGLVTLTYRKQLFRAFDETGFVASAHSLFRTDLVLNIAVAMLVVAGVQAIGNLMVLALLIVPMAIARLLTRDVRILIPLAILAPFLSAALGLWMSFEMSVNLDLAPSPSALLVLILLAQYAAALAAYGLRRLIQRRGQVVIA
jgi:manganese/iron transport system permease protein